MQLMAPWVPAFTGAVARHLESNPFVTVSFATVDKEGNPKVRTCIYRGFLFDDRKTNVLTLTTDTRMEKVEHLSSNSQFEACFWFPGTMEQFRVSGKANVLTRENANEFSAGLGGYPVVSPHSIKQYSSTLDLSALQSQFSLQSNHHGHASISKDEHKPTPEEWAEEFDSKWGSLSTKLKSSFRKPEPGSKITSEKRKLLDSISRGVDGSNEEDGKKNYGLVVLMCDKVDYVNLNHHHDLRYNYERFDDDQWTEDEVCP